MANLSKSKKYTTPDERKASIDSAFDACSIETPVTLKALAEYMGVSERCVRDRIKELRNEYWIQNGIVGRTENRD